MTRSPAELTAEIGRLKRVMSDWNIEGRLDSDTEADMIGEIEDLQGDLYTLTDAEADSTGGFNVPLFTAAMGASPEEIFGEEETA